MIKEASKKGSKILDLTNGQEAIVIKSHGFQGQDELLAIQYLNGQTAALWKSSCSLITY